MSFSQFKCELKLGMTVSPELMQNLTNPNQSGHFYPIFSPQVLVLVFNLTKSACLGFIQFFVLGTQHNLNCPIILHKCPHVFMRTNGTCSHVLYFIRLFFTVEYFTLGCPSLFYGPVFHFGLSVNKCPF